MERTLILVGATTSPHNGRMGDESTLAAGVAAQYSNVDHVIVRSSGTTPFANIDRHFALYQQPVVNRSYNHRLPAK